MTSRRAPVASVPSGKLANVRVSFSEVVCTGVRSRLHWSGSASDRTEARRFRMWIGTGRPGSKKLANRFLPRPGSEWQTR